MRDQAPQVARVDRTRVGLSGRLGEPHEFGKGPTRLAQREVPEGGIDAGEYVLEDLELPDVKEVDRELFAKECADLSRFDKPRTLQVRCHDVFDDVCLVQIGPWWKIGPDLAPAKAAIGVLDPDQQGGSRGHRAERHLRRHTAFCPDREDIGFREGYVVPKSQRLASHVGRMLGGVEIHRCRPD